MSEWKMVKLGDVCKQIRGVSYKPTDVYDALSEKSVTLLRANNIFENSLNYDDLVFVDKKNVSEIQYMKKGDILICASSGSKNLVGKAACLLEDKELTFGAFCKVIRATSINYEYLKHYFFSPIYRSTISHLSAGANINNIKSEDLENLKVPLPSSETQKRIAAVLDKCADIIAKRKQQLSALDDLIKARFVEMFGDPETNPKKWKKSQLNEHAEVIVGYPFPSDGYTTDGIDIIGGYNIMHGFIQWENSKYWSNAQGYEQYLLKPNDIVMAMDRPWVNGGFKIAKIDAIHLPALLIQRTACIRGIDIKQELLYSLLNSQRFAEHCNITGSLVPHISNKDINSFQIILPPMELQNEFVEFVHKVDKSKGNITQSLTKMRILFNSLMQQYFG